MVEAVARLAGDGDRRQDMGFCVGLVEQITGGPIRFGVNQRDEFVDTLGGLSDRPVVAETDDEWGHFGVRPTERKIMSIKRVGHNFASCVPVCHPRVVVQQLIQ